MLGIQSLLSLQNMTLISSISGIRGTIGGKRGINLTPVDVIRFTSAYGAWLLQKHQKGTVVVGRDARPSGAMIQELVQQTPDAPGPGRMWHQVKRRRCACKGASLGWADPPQPGGTAQQKEQDYRNRGEGAVDRFLQARASQFVRGPHWPQRRAAPGFGCHVLAPLTGPRQLQTRGPGR